MLNKLAEYEEKKTSNIQHSTPNSQVESLKAAFRQNGMVLMVDDLFAIGFTDIPGAIEKGIIQRRPGRWDIGFAPGVNLNVWA